MFIDCMHLVYDRVDRGAQRQQLVFVAATIELGLLLPTLPVCSAEGVVPGDSTRWVRGRVDGICPSAET